MSFLKGLMEKEPPEPENPIGIVVIGNLEGDQVHETAREMVRKALKRAQFKTIDLGKGVPAAVLASKAKEVNADIIAVSVNTVPAKNNLAKLDETLKVSGLKGKVILMIGGAAVKKEDAEAIGALYGKSKEEGVEIAKKAIAEKKK
jgi:methanogenic corrinoid protein MtbC1